ncbi:MAG: hypothetical protein ACP5GD_02690 [Candidatus Micrarchaeia archaeon]
MKHKIRMEYAVVDKVLLGYLPIRSIDTAKEYKLIKWSVEPNAEPLSASQPVRK